MEQRTVVVPEPFDLMLTVGGPHAVGPTQGPHGGWWWRATRTPAGPATIAVRQEGGRVAVRAWGDGAAVAIDGAAAYVGLEDEPSRFTPGHPGLRELHRRFRGLRIGRTGAVMEALVPTILAQKVTGAEAGRAWRRLVARYGDPAPEAPGMRPGLRLPPAPPVLARLPYHVFHPIGVERRRAQVIIGACARAGRLEEAAGMPAAEADARLRAIRGIGRWTVAEVARTAFGDPDAVSVGDFHLKNQVSWFLAGEPRATDERMLELLEPWAGQRGRVQRLIELAGVRAPRFGPRVRLRAIERI